MPEEAAAEDPSVEEELELEEFLEDDDEGGGDDEDDDLDLSGDEEGAEEEDDGEGEEEEDEPSPELQALQEQNKNLQGWAGRMRHENRQLLERQERAEARMSRLLEALAKAQGVSIEDLETPEEERIPDEEEDFAGHLKGSVRQELERFYEKIRGDQEQEKQQQAVQGHVEQVKQYHEADIQRFEQQHPDYDAAEAHLLEATRNDIRSAIRRRYPRAPQDQIDAAAEREVMDLVARHQIQFAQEGASLAEYVYQQAVEAGYQPGGEAPAAAPKKKPARGGSADDLRARRKKAGRSLANVSGSAASGKSLKQLADMDDDEFDEAIENLEKSGKDWEKVAAKILA